ncbi:hypothetical protein D3C80_1839920 [compost metagenome]
MAMNISTTLARKGIRQPQSSNCSCVSEVCITWKVMVARARPLNTPMKGRAA